MSSSEDHKDADDDDDDCSSLLIGTRIHLGKASEPPQNLSSVLAKFQGFCNNVLVAVNEGGRTQQQQERRTRVVACIAVDTTPKLPDYDLVETIRGIMGTLSSESISATEERCPIHILPVTPWNSFTPALNALVTFAARERICYSLMVSAETSASGASIQMLWEKVRDDKSGNTLVAGAVLPGHDYHGVEAEDNNKNESVTVVELTGRTTPWNTLCIWNVSKLALTGFPLVAEGLHPETAAGVEEVSTIALLQSILGAEQAVAKLISLPDISWDQNFSDPERKAWHEKKMKSKVGRPAKHLALMGGGMKGIVHHHL